MIGIMSEYCSRAACLLASVSLALLPCGSLASADDQFKAQADIALSALEFGGSLGKLLWVTTNIASPAGDAQVGKYQKLAIDMQKQIEIGRASSTLVSSNFDVIATGIAYVALTDPEPVSKAVAAIAAWGAKKTGDHFAQVALEESQKRSREMLAVGLKDSGLTDDEMDALSADEIRSKVKDLKVGGKAIGEIMENDPDTLRMLQENAVDAATDIGLKALAKAETSAKSVEEMKTDLGNVRKEISKFQEAVSERFDTVENQLSELQSTTQLASEKLNLLTNEVRSNNLAVKALAEISFSGWSTPQKLQAVRSGLFPGLDEGQRNTLEESLEADKAREDVITDIQDTANDLGEIADIAANIGLPPEVVQGVKTAQTAAVGLAKLATGDYLGAIASVTSLVGLGAPDAAAGRHAAMMQYMAEQFAQLNAKLDRIIDLQVQTLQAISQLSKDQQRFRREVLTQLDRIESSVLRNEQILQAILLNEWTECNALINGGTALQGTYLIRTREMLIDIVGAPNINKYAGGCYQRLVSFLDAWVVSADWSGQLIAAENFPTDRIEAETDVLRSWHTYQSQRIAAYRAARELVKVSINDASDRPASYLARFLQPVTTARYQAELASVLARDDIQNEFDTFTCGEAHVVAPGVRDLICHGLGGNDSAPLEATWSRLLDAALIGPHAFGLIDTGVTLATLADLAKKSADGSFSFVAVEEIQNFSEVGPSQILREALAQKKGLTLLTKLRWLTDANLLQQSIAYGDFTAQLAEQILYDPVSKSLKTDLDPNDATKSRLVTAALTAMRLNPTLARNVVLLAMRHAISDSMGGAANAASVGHKQTYYSLALSDFVLPQACSGDPIPREKLGELLPNWIFEFRVTSAQQTADAALETCPLEPAVDPNESTPPPNLGIGATVRVADFYVMLPSPMALSSGQFEQPDSLRLALLYRDKVSQAIIDRQVVPIVEALASGQVQTRDIAFELLNEGWDWSHRTKQAH
ncbi:hypothetical protein [Sinorhizobium meliloti]|uniref:hypothetical protein n=1 Tax=Rhizobium meliloti TaxID=382 RepID=UPI000FD9D48D|nr:hypothetical protein [Sinorhizobium meliloti]RVO52077.1 hypothetical protein CN092_23720 [Sinorhizobium meliloti]